MELEEVGMDDNERVGSELLDEMRRGGEDAVEVVVSAVGGDKDDEEAEAEEEAAAEEDAFDAKPKRKNDMSK